MNFSKLSAKFVPHDLEWRVQSAGESGGRIWARVLTYVDARAVQDRLDEVCGPENWQTTYEEFKGGIICHLSLFMGPNLGWVVKSDGAQETDVEPFKGSLSKALVRAASQWGIGRYLYNLDATFAKIVEKGTPGARLGQTKEKKQFYWLAPDLPKWALPDQPTKPIVTDEQKKEAFKAPEAPPEKPKSKALNELDKMLAQNAHAPQNPLCECGEVMVVSRNRDSVYCPHFKQPGRHSRSVKIAQIQEYMKKQP